MSEVKGRPLEVISCGLYRETPIETVRLSYGSGIWDQIQNSNILPYGDMTREQIEEVAREVFSMGDDRDSRIAELEEEDIEIFRRLEENDI